LFGPGVGRHQEGLRQRCLELGLPFQPATLLSNTRLAVEAAESARDAGKHGEFHRAVLAARFAHAKDIGDVEVLVGVGAEVGLDIPSLRRALADHSYADRRRAAEAEAHALGINGVPTYIFAGGARVVGAQPLDYFRRLLTSEAVGRK
jgi:predicted DsbA family dithiol-disulfide isomerase